MQSARLVHLRFWRSLSIALLFAELSACSSEPATDPPGSGGGPGSGGEIVATGGMSDAPASGGAVATPMPSTGGADSGTGGATDSSGGWGGMQDAPSSGGSDGYPYDPDDHTTTTIDAGTVKVGWNFKNMGPEANYDDGDAPDRCPDPDAMLTPGSVHYADGTWTVEGSGEGFIHGWDQGSLVYYEHPLEGDFTFTAKVEELSMTAGESLNGAAQALLNVREDLGFKQPTHSIIAGAAPDKFQFMARYLWDGENKWWHWPAWPDTWPDSRPVVSWTRLEARGEAIAAYHSVDGVNWELISDNDDGRDWYPFRLTGLGGARYVGLVCSARNDRNLAPMARLPGKSVDCRDPESPELRASARCVFSNVSITQP